MSRAFRHFCRLAGYSLMFLLAGCSLPIVPPQLCMLEAPLEQISPVAASLVKERMSYKEVIEILGSPRNETGRPYMNMPIFHSGTAGVWQQEYWVDSKTTITVEFDEVYGRVSRVMVGKTRFVDENVFESFQRQSRYLFEK